MVQTPTIVLLGTSLFVTGVEAYLRGRSQFDVQRLDPTAIGVREQLHHLQPDVILFDSSDSAPTTLPNLTQLLKESLDIPVIGLDLATNTEVTIFSAHQQEVLKADDLAETIHLLTQSARNRAAGPEADPQPELQAELQAEPEETGKGGISKSSDE